MEMYMKKAIMVITFVVVSSFAYFLGTLAGEFVSETTSERYKTMHDNSSCNNGFCSFSRSIIYGRQNISKRTNGNINRYYKNDAKM